jgi:hypothetical protein
MHLQKVISKKRSGPGYISLRYGSGSATLITGQLERRVPELWHEEADRLGEEALHELVRHALQVPEPAGQKVQQLK